MFLAANTQWRFDIALSKVKESLSADQRMKRKQNKRINTYFPSTRKKKLKYIKVKVIPIIICAYATIPTVQEKGLEICSSLDEITIKIS